MRTLNLYTRFKGREDELHKALEMYAVFKVHSGLVLPQDPGEMQRVLDACLEERYSQLDLHSIDDGYEMLKEKL
jgi:hypothetical protein